MVLVTGNSAKLYCLGKIEELCEKRGGEISILDLGCGTGGQFVSILEKNPRIRYVGVEPCKEDCKKAEMTLGKFNATVINAPAYSLDITIGEKFDVVTSFSALEHVYKRKKYLESAKACMKDDGILFINYDSGHFTSGKDTIKNLVGRMLAKTGNEAYHQAFVKENDFLELVNTLEMEIIESKFFNVPGLKGVQKEIPEGRKEEYAKRWLAFELWLNEVGIEYDDSKAHLFGTRNFILKHKNVVR